MIYIFASRFYNFEKHCINIGGTQTYIQCLAELFVKKGFNVKIFDIKKGRKVVQKDALGVIRIEEFLFDGNLDKAYHNFYRTSVIDDDLVVIGSDEYAIYPGNHENVISIQHGIGWDIPRSFSGKKRYSFLFPLYKFGMNKRRIQKYLTSSNYVCVDYNYYNWLKTVYDVADNRNLKVIPNFTEIKYSHEEIQDKLNNINTPRKARILFARRFQDYRGAIVWAKIVARLSNEYPALTFTFAGEGPCEKEMKRVLSQTPNVMFTQYHTKDSVQFHRQFDIAVIPTFFSEGTSLSACEAMAAGCYPIACHVGGLTNIIIDGFNGTLCYPSEESIYQAVKYVMSLDIEDFRKVSFAAYETVKNAFSKELWEARWVDYLATIRNN